MNGITFSRIYEILAEYYDEELERNHINAKRNVSRIILNLKEKFKEIELNSRGLVEE